MLIFQRHPVSIMVLFAVALHTFWAVAIMFDSAALNANSVNAIARFVHSTSLLVAILLAVSGLALLGVIFRLWWWFLLPQQALLMMSAAGAIESMWLAQFADGVLRPHAFIAADQVYAVIAAVCHTAALLSYSSLSHYSRID